MGTSIAPQLQLDQHGATITSVSEGATAPPSAADSAASPSGNGKASCRSVSIAVMGPLTGRYSVLGKAVLGGAQVAIQAHNSANPGCQIVIKQADAGANSAGVAAGLVGDSSVVAVVGPVTTGEAIDSAGQLSKAGLLTLSPSANTSSLTTKGWATFFRGVASDNAEASAVGHYMVNTMSLFKVCVVADSSAYGQSLATQTKAALGGSLDSACSSSITGGQTDFSKVANSMKAEAPDGIFFAGYYPEAAAMIKQVRKVGVTADFVASDGVNSQDFIVQAGIASAGANIACTCVSAPGTFAATYKAVTGSAPGGYSTEAYDLTTIIAKGIDSGHVDRSGLVKYVSTYQGSGLAGAYAWDKSGNLLNAKGVWINQVQ